MGMNAFVDLTPQWTVPTTNGGEWVDDRRARAVVNKPLYDFGRTAALTRSAALSLDARTQAYVDARAQRRLDILARFFDVLLADLRYAVEEETMAHTYVMFDHGRDRHEIGQLSDVGLLELENDFQQARIQRAEAQARRTSTRVRLGSALNRPGVLPGELSAPELGDLDRPVPEFKDAFELALRVNPRMIAMRHELEAARVAVDAERARRRPVLSAEAEAAYYEREFTSRDERRATVNLRVPLWQGGDDRAAIAQALARLHDREAGLAQAEMDLRQTLWDLLQEIETLKISRQAAKVRSSYRDLYLDRSRALYELEARTDLGDALIRNTEATWLAAQANYRLALAWARYAALTGQPILNEGITR